MLRDIQHLVLVRFHRLFCEPRAPQAYILPSGTHIQQTPTACTSYVSFFSKVELRGWFSILSRILIVPVALLSVYDGLLRLPCTIEVRTTGHLSEVLQPFSALPASGRVYSGYGPFHILGLVHMILTVELTITWNHITDINSLNSNGQLIPLVIGLACLLGILIRIIVVRVPPWDAIWDFWDALKQFAGKQSARCSNNTSIGQSARSSKSSTRSSNNSTVEQPTRRSSESPAKQSARRLNDSAVEHPARCSNDLQGANNMTYPVNDEAVERV